MATTLIETKIGQIPADWKLVKLEDIGVTYGGLTNKNKGDFGKGKPYIPFLNIMNNTKIDLDYFDYVDVQEGEKQNRAKKGDLFFNTSSETPEEVGMCSVLCDDVPELYLNSFCFGFRIEDQNSLLPLFVSYFFRSGVGRKVIFPLAQGMTRYNLSKGYFLQLEIPKPKTEEQRKIAEILSTVDETIEKTDAIIQETQQLKKGLMQKLFTEGIGHTRFKETKIGRIPEDWGVVSIRDINKARFDSINPADIHQEMFEYYSIPAYLECETPVIERGESILSNKLLVKPNTVLFGKLNPRVLKVWFVKLSTAYRQIASTEFLPILTNEKAAPKFLYYLCQSDIIAENSKQYAVGTTPSRQRVNPKAFYNMPIPLPPLSEQRKIAEILSEVDAKIETERAFKSELEMLKKGLMQVLLTGEVRVKV